MPLSKVVSNSLSLTTLAASGAATLSSTLGVTGVTTVQAGTAALPAITTTGDTNTGIFFPAADQVATTVGGTEGMRLTSTGLGIGTSSPASRLNIATGASTSCTFTLTSNNTGTGAGDRGRLDFYSANNSGTAYQLGYMDYDRADGTGTASYIAWASRVSGTVAERMRIDSSGNLQFNSGFGSVATAYAARAWVNFNGTGTVAIRASGNVSSITDNGVADYTVNFTVAMPDINYSSIGTSGFTATAAGAGYVGFNRVGAGGAESAPTTTAVRVNALDSSGSTSADQKYIHVAIFR